MIRGQRAVCGHVFGYGDDAVKFLKLEIPLEKKWSIKVCLDKFFRLSYGNLLYGFQKTLKNLLIYFF